ncbi:MAG TPA: ABC transporter substrate-binding protein [Caulobacterales bacterium]|nr:ABC transporter substrate-binding protein [Caulobacterales bacterium]
MRAVAWKPGRIAAAALAAAALALGLVLLHAGGGRIATEQAQGAVLPERASHAEVMHFWNSGSERSALNEIRQAFERRGGAWIDTSEPDNGALRRALVERISTNTMPAAVLWQSNLELRDMAELGVFGNLDEVADREHWDALLPPAIRSRVRIDGHYYMAPTNVHAINWVFYNRNVLQRIGVDEPRTWPEMIAAMHRARAAGIRPVALGDGEWEVQIMFTTILAGALGREDYRRLISEQNPSVMDKPSALEAFKVLAEIRGMTRRGERYPGWDAAAHGLAHGEAAFNFMGDWAKAEMIRSGGVVGDSLGCMLTPGVQNAIMLTVDGFAFPATTDPEHIAARNMLASVMLNREVQMRFAAAKGTLPARIDARPRQPDRCESILMERLADDTPQLQAPNAGLPSGLAGDFQMLVSRFFADDSMTPEQGRAAMAAMFRSAANRARGR